MRIHRSLSGLVIAIAVIGLANSCTHGLVELSPAFQELKQRIEGRENEPAEQVFDNIQIMQGMPAERVLAIMTNSFAPALGVRCSHCHVDGDWASDDKEPKRIARDMWRMTGAINEQVGEIIGPDAQVRCATCHRGSTRPAVDV
jgi:hypothetical protein